MAKRTSKKRTKKKKKTGSTGSRRQDQYVVQVGHTSRGLAEAEERLMERRDFGLGDAAERAGILRITILIK